MKKSISTYRVPYADTDQMSVVYYANYLEYFERSRTELLRELGYPYSQCEQEGFLLAVKEAHCQYFKAARYDDMLTFVSWVETCKGVSMKVVTEIYREEERIAAGYVILACLDAKTWKLTRLPEKMLSLFSE